MEQTILPHPELDFFKSKHRPYYILTAEWTQQSAGTRVTFQLCHALNELGYEAYVVAQKPAAKLRTPLLTPDIIKRHKAEGRQAISVYTELMWGNTLETDIVVKWITNREGIYSNSVHDDNALYFYFSAGYTENRKERILSIPPVDRSIFNDTGVDNEQRSGFAYFAYKYLKEGKGALPAKFTSKGISLCKDTPRTHKEIADILRSVKVLYVYEDTALVGEAALCGCPTVTVKTDFLTGLQSLYTADDLLLTEDEIDIDADITAPYKLIDRYKYEFKDTYRQLAEFINITQGSDIIYTKKDCLREYCQNHKRIFIYGVGIVGGMVFNALNVAEINVESFIVSDEHYDTVNSYCGVPVRSLTWLMERYNCDCGVILAMTTANREQVIPQLKSNSIQYFD